jgi:hypothetical protein
VFEELMRRDLIDLPDKFVMEEAFFNDTNELEQIFTCAEENNLFVINRLQDAEENLEIELKKKRNLYEVKGRKEKDLK